MDVGARIPGVRGTAASATPPVGVGAPAACERDPVGIDGERLRGDVRGGEEEKGGESAGEEAYGHESGLLKERLEHPGDGNEHDGRMDEQGAVYDKMRGLDRQGIELQACAAGLRGPGTKRPTTVPGRHRAIGARSGTGVRVRRRAVCTGIVRTPDRERSRWPRRSPELLSASPAGAGDRRATPLS